LSHSLKTDLVRKVTTNNLLTYKFKQLLHYIFQLIKQKEMPTS